MQDDLYKPLGQKAETPKTGAPNWLPLVLSLFVVMAGIGIWWTMDDNREQQIITANEIPASTPSGNLPTNKEPASTTPQVTDPNAPPIVEMEANGNMVEPSVPVPQRPIRDIRQEPALAHRPDPGLIEKTQTGSIPRIADDGRRPMDVYSREPMTEGNFGVARVVIIVGGLGISQTSTQRAIRELPGLVTLAFAPYGNSRIRWVQEARKDGHELLLQVPMEPFNYPQNNPGPNTLRTDVSIDENIDNLHWAMGRITNYVGIMNHLGGKLMNDTNTLDPIMGEISRRGLLFLDDGSLRNTRGKDAAQRNLVPYAKGQIQIDGVRSREAIKAQLGQLEREAKRTGLAIGVASAFPETLDMLVQFVRQAEKAGLEITPVSAIVKVPGQG